MSEPGDYGMCPVLGWSGFKNPLGLGQVEMSTLEELCLCWRAEDGGGASKLLSATKKLKLWCPNS